MTEGKRAHIQSIIAKAEGIHLQPEEVTDVHEKKSNAIAKHLIDTDKPVTVEAIASLWTDKRFNESTPKKEEKPAKTEPDAESFKEQILQAAEDAGFEVMEMSIEDEDDVLIDQIQIVNEIKDKLMMASIASAGIRSNRAPIIENNIRQCVTLLEMCLEDFSYDMNDNIVDEYDLRRQKDAIQGYIDRYKAEKPHLFKNSDE